MNKEIVVKVGGSVIYDDDLNINFSLLNRLKEWYLRARDEYSRIIIVVGGGKLSRFVQNKVDGQIEDEEYLHELGMSVTQVNANLIAGFLDDESIYIPKGLGDAYEYLKTEGDVRMVSGGLKSGWSTDLDAVVFADILNVDRVFKISDIEYLYSSDPKDNPNAQPIKDITWDKYFKMFGLSRNSEHIPNSHTPVDVECARFAESKNIGMHITGGKRIEESKKLEELFQGGSYIHP